MNTRRFLSMVGAWVAMGGAVAGAQTPGNGNPEANPHKRIWVRGCPVGADCTSDLRAGMREFEVKLGQANHRGSPWLARSRTGHAASTKPSDVDPALTWLDNVNKPDLPIRWTPELIAYLTFYKSDPRGRAIMGEWLTQQGKYEGLIVSELRRAKLPTDLLYICMIESSYNPREYSRAGASGLWQFMPSGSGIYGLARTHWFDECNDPVKSTKAVMMYFADLYHRFRNWHLAMGAFNQGYNGMLRSIAKYNTNDYWQLLRYENALPRDTALYVPKALAAAIIGRNRAAFGFDKLAVKAPLVWDEVVVPRSTLLSTLAKAAGVGIKQIRELNPQLRRDRTPPGVRNYSVRIPRGSGTRFSASYDRYRSEWDSHDAYPVSHGERLADIAAMHGVSVHSLQQLNDLSPGATIGGGSVLVVPRVSAAHKRINSERAKRRASRRSRRGAHEPVLIAVPDKDFRLPGKRAVFYRVVGGDSMRSLSRAFRVDRAQLAAWNRLHARGHLYPGMILQVFVDPEFSLRRARIKALDADQVTLVTRGSSEHLHLAELRRGRQRVVYRASGRESFAHIGNKFGLTARDLARINRKPPSSIVQRGEEIIVYKVLDPSRSPYAARQARRLHKERTRIARQQAAAERRKRDEARARADEGRKRRASARRKRDSTPAKRQARSKRASTPAKRQARSKRTRNRSRRVPASIRRRSVVD